MIVMISWPIIMSSNFFTSFSIIDHLKATISKTAISLKRHNRWLFFEAMISLEVIRLCDVLRESLDIDLSTPVIMHSAHTSLFNVLYVCRVWVEKSLCTRIIGQHCPTHPSGEAIKPKFLFHRNQKNYASQNVEHQ